MKRKEKLDTENLNEVIRISKKILSIGLIVAIISLVVLISYLLKTWKVFEFVKACLIVISPVFIGFVIAWLFDPIVEFLEKKKLPRLVACLLVYIVFFGGLILLLTLLTPTFTHQVKDFVGSIPATLKDIKHFLTNIINSFASNNGFDLTGVKNQIFASIENFGINLTTNLPNNLLNILKSIISGGMIIVLGIMIGFYMLYDFNKVSDNIIGILPKTWRNDAKELFIRINESLRGYVQGVFVVMFLVFITQSIGLTLSGIKAPLIFALFCALTDIIPYFGPYIGAIPAVIVGFTMSPKVGICTIISIVVVQLLENNFYQPIIMGKTMKLHPVTIILGLLIFEHFFGIIGMIIATPVIACLKVVLTFINEKVNIVDKIIG